ncbi:Outer membrane efflux protein [Stieleria maiorica]|uniref:Outer membrane efflux protein n=1 Tax=Stieleria maiorica TaxID=2795974 RepID=A0A5B9MN64_9BACT|nr:TolC family protein [Stieleria maiorica]QEG00996.1 Outer membrane efflux protein [Stieleria maiorica]
MQAIWEPNRMGHQPDLQDRRKRSVGNRRSEGQPLIGLLLLACFGSVIGCARSGYRQAADSEAYCLVKSRQSDPRWSIPHRAVEPRRRSRMYVANEQDCGPKPPDDLAAHRYMTLPDCKPVAYYDQIPTRTHVENPVWLDYLPRNEDGSVKLTQSMAIELALLHSRDYQSEFENVYLTALELSGNRFEFDTQWFGGFGTTFAATGSDLGGDRILALSDRLGFGRNLAGGGQFATEVLNGLSWNFGSGGVQSGSAAIISTFTQPLLRGAFRHVRLESLTQAERNLLYQVRDFARFRRQFYVDLTESYLGLLTQKQAIRNTQTNVENLRQNLEEHKVYAALKVVSQVQVDQVFQQYQNGRRTLLASEQQLITSEDQYKFSLGLPAWVTFEIDESLLKQFELVDPELITLQDQAQQLFESLVQFLPPSRAPAESLIELFQQYRQLRERVATVLPEVESDFQIWRERIASLDTSRLSEDDRLDIEQQEQLAERIEATLADLRAGLSDRGEEDARLKRQLTEYETNPPKAEEQNEEQTLEEILRGVESFEEVRIEDILPDETDDIAIVAWKALEEAIGRKLREEIAELYVAQTQVKLFLIDIEPLTIGSENAITFAHQNRLDLMNRKAIVMDSFRRVEVAADALESDLDVTGGVTIGSDADSNSPFKLDSANNRYSLGVRFDGPLNRLNERNTYRASQIAYQQASRNFIATKDSIANEVRQVLRRLELSRLNFQIARQQVVAATRLVDQAQIDLRRSSQADSNLTIVLLQALEGMLDAKNSLIVNWVQYRVQKMRLFEALELLYLDENGVWVNESSGLAMLQDFQAIDPEYFPPQWHSSDQTEAVFQDLPRLQTEALPLPLPEPSGPGESKLDEIELEPAP